LNAGNGASTRLRLLEKPFSAGARRGTSRHASLGGLQPKAAFSEKRGMALLSLFIAGVAIHNRFIKTHSAGKCKGKLRVSAQINCCTRATGQVCAAGSTVVWIVSCSLSI